jgi:acyl dehydratase
MTYAQTHASRTWTTRTVERLGITGVIAVCESEVREMRTFESLAAFRAAVGTTLGTSEWFEINQARVDAFADATLDHQWLHVDPQRAQNGPFGGTVAHGYLTLALIPHLTRDTYHIENIAMGVNYGLDKVRFPAPVRVGSLVRARVDLADAVGDDQTLTAHLDVTIEVERQERPGLTARALARLVAS